MDSFEARRIGGETDMISSIPGSNTNATRTLGCDAMQKLILASRSPRRRELLEEAGYLFEVVPPSDKAECGVCSGENPFQMVARLAHQKAADVASGISEGLILGCDTVAECNGQILGKPATAMRGVCWRHARSGVSGTERPVPLNKPYHEPA